ncbi:hypothetical protein SeMB42_g03667 [Synchytrium endobioticum]|uniref:Tubulin--tyrosine ligase-like protein 9 n=1 Tax=Synchytrium endobioticum TaxID=286115 RepID=A0A507D5C5_9FUNG|nr:hypothetical protein SeMB42_g03667 [Synchytrium endobioticum]TPX46810.1 hypothetical protein SeLEV6574_g03010 [Synchytrium endobioticum]
MSTARDSSNSLRSNERPSISNSAETLNPSASSSGTHGISTNKLLPHGSAPSGPLCSPARSREHDQKDDGPRRDVIRFRTSLRNTICDVMRDRGWKETDSDTDWDVFWADVHWLHEFFDKSYFSEYQRINHFRNHYELTRKDLLVKNIKRTLRAVEREHGPEAASKFDFVSQSFSLPSEHALFSEEFKRTPGAVWIMKPAGRAQGKGIFLINKLSQVNGWKRPDANKKRITGSNTSLAGNAARASQLSSAAKKNAEQEEEEGVEAYIVQRYIENPFLIGGKKFDIRAYVLVTSYAPLTVYLHRNGFCRFSNTQFSMNARDISNLYIHATNVAIQKTAPNYVAAKGCKWLLRSLKRYVATHRGQEAAETLFSEMEQLVVRALLSVQKVMINDKHCFELYGYDILVDNNLKPWLLEVNASPSLSAETAWDYDLKHAVLNDMFDVVDLEREHASHKGPRTKVGGFDLIYNDGPVQKGGNNGGHVSYLGCYCPINEAPKSRRRKREMLGHGSSS